MSTVPAGSVGDWLDAADAVVAGERTADVPCAGCTACCTAGQFVHIAPDEAETLAAVPAELRFPAPGLPAGHVVLPYDERGHCPMLVDGGCSIYAVRPRTCRTYDCRVFTVADVAPADPGVAARVARWRFDVADADRGRLEAVRAASAYLRAHRDDLPPGAVPVNPTQLAVVAVRIHDVFLAGGVQREDVVRRLAELRR